MQKVLYFCIVFNSSRNFEGSQEVSKEESAEQIAGTAVYVEESNQELIDEYLDEEGNEESWAEESISGAGDGSGHGKHIRAVLALFILACMPNYWVKHIAIETCCHRNILP